MFLISLLKNASSYILGSFLVQGLTFFTLPVFAKIMTPQDFGFYSSYLFWVTFITTIIGLQTYSSINNAYIDFGEKNIFRYASSISICAWGSFFIVLLFTFLIKDSLILLFELPLNILLLGIVQSFFTYFFNNLTFIYRVLSSPKQYLILSISNSMLNIILSIFIIKNIYFQQKYFGRVYSSVFITLIIGLFCLIVIYKKGKIFFNYEYIKYSLKFSLPLILHSIAAIFFTRCDQLMLVKMINPTIAGIYSFGTNFGHIMYVLYTSTNQAFIPWYYKTLNENRIFLIKKLSSYYILILFGVYSILVFIMPELISFMSNERYFLAKYSAPLIAFGFFINFLYTFPVNYEFFLKQTKFIAVGTISSSIVNIIFNFILIPTFGEIGAALATVISYISLLIFHLYIAKNIIKNYELKVSLFFYFSFFAIIIVALYYIFIEILFVRILFIILIFIFLLFIILKMKKTLLGSEKNEH